MNLNVALILRLVDRVSGPARAVATAVSRIGEGWESQGRAALEWNKRATEAHEQRANALRMEAAETAALGFAVASFLKPAIDFEDQMGRVAAKLQSTATETAMLSSEARRLGATTAWSASEAAGGMDELAEAGFNASQIIAAMPGLLALASAGNEDIATTADIATSILRGFNLEASETMRVADVLANTSINSNAALRDLGETMKYVAPIARNAGVSLEVASAMTGILANNAIKGSQAGTGLAAILTRLQAPTGKAADLLDQLGINVLDARGNMRDAVTVLRELDASMSSLGGGQRAAIIGELVGAEASAELQILLEAARSGALDNLTRQVTQVGSAIRVANQIEANTKGGLRAFGGVFEEFQIAAGTALLPLLSDLLKTATPLVAQMGAWAAANPELVSTIGQLALALIATKVALIGVSFAASTVTGPLLGLHRGIAGAATAVGWLRKGLGIVIAFGQGVALSVAAFGGWGAVFAAVGTALTGPIGIALAVVAAFATAAFLVVRNWDKVGPWLAGVWSGIVTAAQGAWTVIKALFMTFSPLGLIIREWGPITGFFASVWQGIKDGVAGVAGSLAGSLQAIAPDWLVGAWQGAGAVFAGVWDSLTTGAANAWANLTKEAPDAWAKVSAGAGKLWSLVERAATGEFNIWGAIADQLSGFSWGGLIPAVDWTAILTKIDWRWFVPVVGWALLMGELAWSKLIPAIRWRDWLPSNWAALLPRWNWRAIIPRVNLSEFVQQGAAGRAPTPAARGTDTGQRIQAGAPARVQARATGGPFGPGPLLVGEKGPELYYPDRAGFIAHNGQLLALAGLAERVAAAPPIRLVPTGRAAREAAGGLGSDRERPMRRGMAGAPSLTFTGDWHFHTQPGQDPREIARAVMAEIEGRVAQARRAALHDLEDTADG